MTDTNSSSSTMALDAKLAVSRSKTEFKVIKFSHVWTIENYSFCTKELGEYLESPTFSADPNDQQQQSKWCLELYPKGKKEESKNWVELYLRLQPNKTTEPVSAKFKLCILKANGEQANVDGPEEEADKFGPGSWEWGYNFIRRNFLLDPKNGLLPNDQLSIFCEVSMVVETVNVRTPVPQFRLSADMGTLLEESSFSDCVLCSADGKEFQVHKGVLACRSPVFAAMFTNETEEKRTNRVNIEDVSAPVLGQLLHFLYTGCEPKLLAEQVMAEGLLVAADKYQLDRLKAICQNQLCLQLTKENVFNMMALADRHSAEHLKDLAIEYICSHADEVMESDEWCALVASDPKLYKRIFRQFRKRSAPESGAVPSPKQTKQ